MSNVLRWDELNILKQDAETFIRQAEKRKPTAEEMDRWLGYMEYVLCLIYDYGWKDAEEVIGPVATQYRMRLESEAVNLELDGETFRDRVREQVKLASLAGLLRIIETEAHRDYNTGVYDAARESGETGLMKRWHTMLDNRVRDPHAYMEGMKVGLEDYFYTYTGDYTLYPGGFGVPDLDINCRCWVTIER